MKEIMFVCFISSAVGAFIACTICFMLETIAIKCAIAELKKRYEE